MPIFPPLTTRNPKPSDSFDRVVRKDLRSANWNGGGSLEAKDGTATAGYLLDYATGSAQFQSIFAEGGSLGVLTVDDVLTVENEILLGTGGVIRTAASPGERIEFKENAAAGSSKMAFYTGHTDEQVAGSLYGGSDDTGGGRAWLGLRAPDVIDNSGNTFLGLFSPTDDDSTFYPYVIVGYDGASTQTARFVVHSSMKVGIANLGTAAAPSIGIGSNYDDGIWSPSDSILAWSIAGVEKMRLTTTDFFDNSASRSWNLGLGTPSAAAVPYAFQGDPNTGMMSPDADEIQLVTGSGWRIWVGSTEWLFNVPARSNINGTVSAPSYSWNADPNTGLYHSATADYFLAAAGGVNAMQWGETGNAAEIYMYYLTANGDADPAIKVDVATGFLTYQSSRREIKKNIGPIDTDTEQFMRLQPSRFKLRDTPKKKHSHWHLGFIAEEAAAVDERLASWGHLEFGDVDADGSPVATGEKVPIDIADRAILSMTVKELQKVIERVDVLEGA